MNNKIDIRQIIEPANFELIKSKINSVNDLIQQGLDETRAYDFEEHINKPCYYLYDRVENYIREVYLGDIFIKKYTLDVLEDLDIFIFDLYYRDIVDNFITDENIQLKMYQNESYSELYRYIILNKIQISKWELNVLKILAYGDTTNIIEFNN